MSGIWSILTDYEGSGALLLLYAAAFLCLLFREKNRTRRLLLVWVPLVCLLGFVLPPFYRFYSRLDSAGTYYRILWLIPMGLTIGWCTVSVFRDNLRVGLVIACGLIILCGEYTYRSDNQNLLPAENRLHLPQMVLDISDFIMNETDGEQTTAAMPAGLVQFVRQYNAKIIMPYGRDMQMGDYYNPVYYAMEKNDPIRSDELLSALDEYDCGFLVIETSRVLEINDELVDGGLTFLADVDGYRIYRCPYEQEMQELYQQYLNGTGPDSGAGQE